jgi:hypothetical protein
MAIVINCDYSKKNDLKEKILHVEKSFLHKAVTLPATDWSTVLQWATGVIPVFPHSQQD